MQRIKKLAAQQLIVVPYSSLHEDETRQWSARDDLLEFIKVSSGGHRFERPYKLERTQMLRAFRAWLDGEQSRYVPEGAEALTPRAHNWGGYIIVDVHFDRGDGSTEWANKVASAKALVSLFDGWRSLQSTFKDDFNGELEAQAERYIRQYIDWFVANSRGDFDPLAEIPMIYFMSRLLPESLDMTGVAEKCRGFFRSDHFAKVPLYAITCSTHATLKKKVMAGAYTNHREALRRLRGYYTDLDHIAHYAPYCDAIAIDKPMAEMMNNPGVALESKYGVKVFSLNSVDQFDAWLDTIEASMTDEHRDALREVYG